MRKHKRAHLIEYLEILDHNSGLHIGHLADIAPQGIMVVSQESIPPGRDFSFQLLLPETHTDRKGIVFTARCLWCKKDVNPDFYVSGFQINEITAHEIKIIQDLIKTHGFKSR